MINAQMFVLHAQDQVSKTALVVILDTSSQNQIKTASSATKLAQFVQGLMMVTAQVVPQDTICLVIPNDALNVNLDAMNVKASESAKNAKKVFISIILMKKTQIVQNALLGARNVKKPTIINAQNASQDIMKLKQAIMLNVQNALQTAKIVIKKENR